MRSRGGSQGLKLFCAAIAGFTTASTAKADDFAVIASPPHFELEAKPATPIREIVEITNAGSTAAKYKIMTADWTLDRNAGAQFTQSLRPGSCRPWVAIERGEISLASRGKYRFRFEVAPPADAPRGECRFALLIEGAEETVTTPKGVSFPVAGRLGVIVYVAIGGAAPDLQLAGAEVGTINGEPLPVLKIRNAGDAHGRLDGFLSGTDAKGQDFEFSPTTLPILPGETRAISLIVNSDDEHSVRHIAYPITISGSLETGMGKALKFEQRFVR